MIDRLFSSPLVFSPSFIAGVILSSAAAVGCGSATDNGMMTGQSTMNPGTSAGGTAQNANPAVGGTATGSAQGGMSSTGGSTGTATGGTFSAGGNGPISAGGGNTATGGDSAGGSPTVSSGGTPGAGGTGTIIDPNAADDTPAPRPLNVTAAPMQYVHDVMGKPMAVDTQVPHLMGKLIVDLGVDSGGLYGPGLRRGFHVTAVQFFHCDINQDTREHNGDCRLNTFDGMPHGDQTNVGPVDSISGKLKAMLTQAAGDFPEEDWGYYLNADGNVRWSDVAFTGVSHGAQTAARIGMAVRLYRAVSRSGPRDNACGDGMLHSDVYDPMNPPFDVNCPDSKISLWIDEVPQTPVDRFFAFVGNQDGQYGDDFFTMQRIGFVGQPANISTEAAPYNGSHRFYANDGHSGFEDEAKYGAALSIAWGVPPENAAWAAAHPQ